MMKKLGLVLLIGIIAAGIAALVIPKKILRNIYMYAKFSKIETRKTEPLVAIFNRERRELNTRPPKMQYYYFLITDKRLQFPETEYNVENNQPIFITVDMWNNFISENPLESIIKGKYDQKIKEMCGRFADKSGPVYIRWDVEMEVPVNLYPWQRQSPLLYNDAFKHFSNLCKKLLPRANMVWSAAGYPGVLEYYPGDDLIDYVSVTLQSASEKSAKAHDNFKSIADEVERKVMRMRFINKPVLVLAQTNQQNDEKLASALQKAALTLDENRELLYENIEPGIKSSDQMPVRTNLNLGAYDPKNQLSQVKEISIEHLFPNWGDLQSGAFRKDFNAIVARRHDAIVTMEPWRDMDGNTDLNVLENIIKGQYDDRLIQLFSILSATNQKVYLRWTHEMEIPVTRYPWQSKPPITYIKAFRHFASFRKPEYSNIKIVFGPTGDRGLQDWWPGDDVIDYISMAIYGLPDKNITDHKQQETFKTIYNRKLYRMRFFNKPIIISEFGISGPEDFQANWLMEAAETVNSNPQIIALCYFNMVDTPKAWGDIEAPDWGVTPATFERFANALNFNRPDNQLISKK